MNQNSVLSDGPVKGHVDQLEVSLKSTQLDEVFWKNFAKNYWEKKPLLLHKVKSSLLEIEASEIFDLLVLFSNRCRKLKNPEGFKFYINGFKADSEDVLQVLPVKKDQSLLGYHRRMAALFSDYCLVCDELLMVNQKKQNILSEFTKTLYRHIGFPNRFTEMGLYLGNYRKTPFGVHVDSCGVFSFPVVGKKTFRLWTPDFIKKNPDLERAFEYEKFKRGSQLLELRPGDLSYWPSSAWHIAESDGTFSATWSLGVWVDQPHEDLFSENLKLLLKKKQGPQGQRPTTSFQALHSDRGELAALPDAYLRSLKLLKDLSSKELQEHFELAWMKHISLQGFKKLPASDLKVSARSKIKLRSSQDFILWKRSRVTKAKYHFCFSDTLIELTRCDEFLKLIKDLNQGKTCLVSTYLKGPEHKAGILSLQLLADAGAFDSSASSLRK